MCSYTIVAMIIKVEKSNLFFKGIGEHFQKVNDFSRNILSSKDDLKKLKLEDSYFVLNDSDNLTCDAFYRELLIRSMLDKKPLKLEFELNGQDSIVKLNSVALVNC